MKIIQIEVLLTLILGLGDDGKLYYYNTNLAEPTWTEYTGQ